MAWAHTDSFQNISGLTLVSSTNVGTAEVTVLINCPTAPAEKACLTSLGIRAVKMKFKLEEPGTKPKYRIKTQNGCPNHQVIALCTATHEGS